MKDILKKNKTYIKKGRQRFFDLNHPDFSVKKRNNLRKIMLPSGRFFVLPIDQGLEHGPSDFLSNPDCGDPEYQLKLACEAGFSAIALQIGLARKYWLLPEYKKNISLVVKLNGKTCIPKGIPPFSTLESTVQEAYQLGAAAVGYTLYVGSEKQGGDFIQLRQVRQEAMKYDLPLIVWAYPRGKTVSKDGGKDSLAAVDYAVRVAMELGADVVKFNLPSFPKNGFEQEGCFKEYNGLAKLSEEERLQKVIITAGRLGTLLSGGSQVGETRVLNHVRMAVKCGIDGVIFGRNIWQREYKEALALSGKIRDILMK